MIAALEATGADASVLTHHAVAAGDVAADPAVRGRRGGRGGPLRRAPRGRRVLRARPALPGRRPGDARGAAGGTVHGALPHRPAVRRDRGADAGARAAPRAGRRRRRSARHTGRSRSSTGTRPISRPRSGRTRRRIAILDGAGDDRERSVTPSPTAPSSRPQRRRPGRGAAVRDRARSGSRTSWATRPCTAPPSIGVAIARLRGGDVRGAGRPARGRATSACGSGIDELATAPMSHLATTTSSRGGSAEADAVAGRCPAAQRGARHPDLQHVAARGAGPAAAAAGPLAGGRAGRPRRARRRGPPAGPAVAASRARAAGRPARRAAGEPAPGRAVADRADGSTCPACSPPPRLRSPRTPGSPGDPTRGSTTRACRSSSPGRRRASTRRRSLGRWARRLAAAGRAGPRARCRTPPTPPTLEPYEQALALWDAGDHRRPAGRAPGARRARTPGRSPPSSAPGCASAGVSGVPRGPVGGHAGQSGRADRPPARRAGPAGRRAEQRRHRRPPGHLAARPPTTTCRRSWPSWTSGRAARPSRPHGGWCLAPCPATSRCGQESAVAGPNSAATVTTRSAGNPPRRACSRTVSASSVSCRQ